MKNNYQLTRLFRQKQEVQLDQLDRQSRLAVQKLLTPEKQAMDAQDQRQEQNDWLYIDPLSGFTLTWNLIYLVLFYLAELQISVSVTFQRNGLTNMISTQNQYYPAYIFLLVYWCVDCFLSFFKAYYAFAKAQITTNLKLIVFHYLKSQFPFDIIVILIYCIPLIYQAPGVNFLQLIPMFLLWIKMVKYSEEINKILEYRQLLQTIFKLTELFSTALMISNYLACIFLGMDIQLYNQSYYGTGTSSSYYWLTDNTSFPISLIDGPWWQAYVWAVSFSTGTLSTLAPGPFARNPLEATYAIFVMILLVILASYVGDVIAQRWGTFYERKQTHQDNILSFDNFMHLKQVKKDVRIKVNCYFQLVWEVQMKMDSNQHQELIEKLPTYLKEELLLEIGFTKHLHFLQELSIDNDLKKMVSLKMQRSTIDSNACVFESGRALTGDQRKVLYIKEGMAKFYLPQRHSPQLSNSRKEKVLSLSNVSKVLGAYEFVTGQSYAMCCKSIDLCLIQSLKWSEFWEIVSELQIEEQFHQMKHRVLYQRQLSHIDKLCVICLSQHVQSQCPQLFYRHKVLQTVNLSKFQPTKCLRRKKQRKDMKRKKSFISSLNLGVLFISQLLTKIDTKIPFQRQILQVYSNRVELQEVNLYQNYQTNHNIVTD